MNPNKELLQAIIDGKTVQYQYVNPDDDCPALLGYWIDLKPDLSGILNCGPVNQIMTGSSGSKFHYIFQVID